MIVCYPSPRPKDCVLTIPIVILDPPFQCHLPASSSYGLVTGPADDLAQGGIFHYPLHVALDGGCGDVQRVSKLSDGGAAGQAIAAILVDVPSLSGARCMMSDNTRMTAREVLDQIRKGREALAALWGGLTEEQMVRRPGPQEDWSVKDLIAHVTWWESFILKRVTDLINGAKSEPAEHQDVLNARAYERHKDSPLAEVLAAFDANWPKLEALISSLSDEQINTPAYYRTYDGIALLPVLRAGTFSHYPGHITDLCAYVERLFPPT
jgi:hypothetical protein